MTAHAVARARFDRWSVGYDDSALRPVYDSAHRALLDAVAALDVRPQWMLDIGCGTGRLLRAAAHRFPVARLLGLDLSGGMLTMAARGSAPAGAAARWWVRATAERLPLRSGRLDLVTATLSLRHWADPHAALAEVGRVMASDALLAVADVWPCQRRGAVRRIVGRRAWGPPTPLAQALDGSFSVTPLSAVG